MLIGNTYLHIAAPKTNVGEPSTDWVHHHVMPANFVLSKPKSTNGSFAVTRKKTAPGKALVTGGPTGAIRVRAPTQPVTPSSGENPTKKAAAAPVSILSKTPQKKKVTKSLPSSSESPKKTVSFLSGHTTSRLPQQLASAPSIHSRTVETSPAAPAVAEQGDTAATHRTGGGHRGHFDAPTGYSSQGGAPKTAGPLPVASLFTGNPSIPTLQRADVTAITEEVFSGDAFSTLDISPVLVSQITKLGYKSLTVVQQRAIPPILQGKDVLIKSQTGSGKTLTYVLPIINSLLTMTPRVDRTKGVMALIVVPTRELAVQTYEWVGDLCKACVSIVPGILKGGESKKAEKRRLRRGVNILVATPGRLLDHIGSTECLALRNVRFFVLDEADRMLEMGYEQSIANITEALVEAKKFGDEKRFEGKHNRIYGSAPGGQKRPLLEDGGGAARKMFRANDNSAVARGSDGETSHNNMDDDDDSEDERPNEDIDDINDIAEPDVNSKSETINIRQCVTAVSSNSTDAPPRHQTVMLSATLSAQVEKLAGLNLHQPVVVAVSGDVSDGLSGTAAITPELLVHHYVVVPAKLRLVTLAAFILDKCLYSSNHKMLVFMATQDMVDYHTVLLNRVLARYGSVDKKDDMEDVNALELEADTLLDNICTTKKSSKQEQQQQDLAVDEQGEPLIEFMQLRGNMAQPDRTAVFNRFRTATSGVLLCTDVASRGLDLPSVGWIVQYNAPGSVTDYIHRVGRTSRANTRGDALLMLAPSEVGYVTLLEQAQISIDEILATNILQTFKKSPPKMDPDFRVPRSPEEGATRLQLVCEKVLLATPDMLEQARKAYISFVRSYASYPLTVRNVLCYKALHLGHYAKSCALREAPSALGATAAYKAQAVHRVKKETKERREKIKLTGVRAQRQGAVPRMATMSEYDSGLDGLAALLSKNKMEQSKRHNHIKANNRGPQANTNSHKVIHNRKPIMTNTKKSKKSHASNK